MHSNALSRRRLRRRLLGTASAVALLGVMQAPQAARADDAAGFHLWLDLTGQYSMNSGGKTVYGEPFDDGTNAFHPTVGVRGPGGGDGTIGLTLQEDDWFFNLKFNYGRTGTSRADFFSK